jgi:5-methylcytosine-specific restriction protein A
MDRPYRPCKHIGCPELTRDKTGYCDTHKVEYKERDYRTENNRRGTAASKGYGYKWQKYRERFFHNPDNQICKLHLPGCTIIATEIDHVRAPSGPQDPLFWMASNHQPACRHCNSIKGRKTMKGAFEL